MRRLPIIAITMGDPAGIGPEIILKAGREDIFKFCTPIVVGDYRFLERLNKRFNIPVTICSIQRIDEISALSERLYVLDLHNIDYDKVEEGKVNRLAGKASVEYITKAAHLVLKGEVDAITTAPINKEGLHLAGYSYAGHTELLSELTRTEDYAMMLVGGDIRVVLVTIHTPLRDVSDLIKKERITRIIRLTHSSLRSFGIKSPHIAVSALNPHGGEGGIFGNEEITEIIPAVKETCSSGIDIEGPFPADTLFTPAGREGFDAVIVMYHDQGLIPIKMASFGKGVNVTLGLPVIRTSVDHGTAYDIAGKGAADPSSLIEALRLAAGLVHGKFS